LSEVPCLTVNWEVNMLFTLMFFCAGAAVVLIVFAAFTGFKDVWNVLDRPHSDEHDPHPSNPRPH
jgi:hypothetical protein